MAREGDPKNVYNPEPFFFNVFVFEEVKYLTTGKLSNFKDQGV